MRWTPSTRWHLSGTYLMLVENAAGGWFVVDERDEDRSIGQALTLVKAKQLGLRLAKADSKYMRIAR
jgi:hypothetical protein